METPNQKYKFYETMEHGTEKYTSGYSQEVPPNWFQKLPLHFRYLYYMAGGIVIGYLIRVTQEIF